MFSLPNIGIIVPSHFRHKRHMPFTSDNTRTSLIFPIYILNGYRKPPTSQSSSSHHVHHDTWALHIFEIAFHSSTDRSSALPFPCSNNAPFQRLHFSLFPFEKMRVRVVGNRWREKFIHSFIEDIILFDWKTSVIKLTNIRNCDICRTWLTWPQS